MSDTATTTANAANTGATTPGTEGAQAKRKFDVAYTLEVVDELPEGGRPGGSGQSPLEVQLEKVVKAVQEDTSKRGKWMLIGRYGKPTAGGAAANVLRIRHGRDMSVEGFEFAVRPLGGGTDDRGLFVRYDDTKIVDGAKAEHERSEAARLAKLEAKRNERSGAKENGSTSTSSASSASNEPAPDPAAKAKAAAKAAGK